jgi:SAM-dependent methyltransferase
MTHTHSVPPSDGQRTMDTLSFVLSQLPSASARVLEVGCGAGALARALAAAGHQVTAIDPVAPTGEIFRQVSLEAFAEPGPFDAVIAQLSLHHVGDLAAAFSKIHRLLHPGGVLVVDEWAEDRFLDEATMRWYYHQRQARAAAGQSDTALAATFAEWQREWAAQHRGQHGFTALHGELVRHFRERLITWGPYLYCYELDEALQPLEQKLIAHGAIQATGFRWVGERA